MFFVCVKDVVGVVVFEIWVLNEVMVEKVSCECMIEVVFEIDGCLLFSFGCDGMVILMLIGFMVYNFFVGGLVIWLSVEVIVVVLLLVYVLFVKLFVVSFDVVVVIEMFECIDGFGIFWCDGCCFYDLLFGVWVVVCCFL